MAHEREVSAATAWELRFLEAWRKTLALRRQVIQRDLLVVATEEARWKQDFDAALARLGTKEGDELIQRGEKFILIIGEKGAPAPVPPTANESAPVPESATVPTGEKG